jgi:RNA polymerase sigma-70 factor, ECF subfamily
VPRSSESRHSERSVVTAGVAEGPGTERVSADEVRLVGLACAGDQGAFGELAGAYRAELRAHCYRMTGSVADAEDALQEGLLRAWRGLAGFQGRGSVRSWLYAIVTNAALDLARHRSRREVPVSFGPAAGPEGGFDPPLTDQPWLDPYPDHWLAGDARLSPEARYEQRESVELAFLVALQHLPPRQRAVLLLREVVGFSAAEIAAQLGTTAASVNSALQRARAAVRSRLPATSQQSALRARGDQQTRALVQRYADAIERGDADTLIAMLTADASWSMPPVPTWYRGHAAIRQWLVSSPLTYLWRHLPARANGQLAVGCYLFDQAKGKYVPAVMDVLTLDGPKIGDITGFLAAELSTELPPAAPHPGTDDPLAEPARRAWISGRDLFSRFSLPVELPERHNAARLGRNALNGAGPSHGHEQVFARR